MRRTKRASSDLRLVTEDTSRSELKPRFSAASPPAAPRTAVPHPRALAPAGLQVPELQNNEQGRELCFGSTLSIKTVFRLGILLAIGYLAGSARVQRKSRL
jgi:hypothetical protein